MPPENVKELCEKARAAVRKRRLPEAVAFYERALKESPDDAAIHEGLATAFCLAEDYERAIAEFIRITQLKPRDARAWVNLGALHNLREDYAAAVEALRKGIQRDSRNLEAYYNLGIAQRKLSHPQLAISAYRECLRLNPAMLEAHLNLANIFVEQSNFKQATDHYQSILKLKPDHASALRGLAHVQHLREKNRVETSPFGRLVDTSKLVERNAVQRPSRHMSEDERFQDRQMIQLGVEDSSNIALHLMQHLRDHVESGLLATSRILALDPDQRLGAADIFDQLHESIRFSEQLFENWRREFHQLREHENAMTAEPS